MSFTHKRDFPDKPDKEILKKATDLLSYIYKELSMNPMICRLFDKEKIVEIKIFLKDHFYHD